jgi:deoxyribose-phosphate aldolase
LEDITVEELASKINNTIVYPEATYSEIKAFCERSMQYGFSAVVVQGCWVELAKDILKGSRTKVSVGIGFPMGGSTKESKMEEIRVTREKGADMFEYMPNIGFLKSGFYDRFLDELKEAVKEARGRDVRVMLELQILSHEERLKAVKLCEIAGVAGVKNSSGWGKGGHATVEDIRLLRSITSPSLYVKASGGIRDVDRALSLIKAGADYLGTRSGFEIIDQLRERTK